MSEHNEENPWDFSGIDYYGYGDDSPEYSMLPPAPVTDWKTEREARQAAEDAEVARRVASHPGYDDDAFFERQMERSKLPHPPGTYCARHLRAIGINERDGDGKSICTWCHPRFHSSYAASVAPRDMNDKKALAVWRKAQQAQEEIKKINAKIDEELVLASNLLRQGDDS